MDEPKKRGPKPKTEQAEQGTTYRNLRAGVVDLKGVVFEAHEVRTLTAEECEQANIARAIECGLIAEGE